MTNCYETELFQNGKSLGRRRPDPTDREKCMPVWHLPFRPGVLTAKGYDEKGKILCEDHRITPGETDRLSLQCEDNMLYADGWDLAFVTVTAEDQQGNPVRNARNRLKISVEGGGQLIGTDNGDSTDPDGYKSDCRRLFSGKLLLIIRSNGRKEDVTVRVRSGNGLQGVLVIPVKAAALKEGTSCQQQAYSMPFRESTELRRLDIRAEGTTQLTAEQPECTFTYRLIPPEAEKARIEWEATNAAGIRSPYVTVRQEENRVTVRAEGDGKYYLRGLCGDREGTYDFISQLEFSALGTGKPSLDPYSYISAGLYDLHEGNIGTGNEKGIAFDRYGESMIGFSRVDFGPTGSDTLTADIFALNDDPYDLELQTCSMDGAKKTTVMLHYEKPSIWNVYQPETWKLPERLTGLQTVSFRMNDKIHMKGFCFEKQMNAYISHSAGSADLLYGDCYTREGNAVNRIGNNVTLTWNNMDFGGEQEVIAEIHGKTPLDLNTICIRITGTQGTECNNAVEFSGKDGEVQQFRIRVPEGSCTVSFVFLPGSSFDFRSFRFYPPETGQTAENKVK
jgi:beta-galactosidase